MTAAGGGASILLRRIGAYLIDIALLFLVLGMAWRTGGRRSVHDRAAGTRVVAGR